MVYKISNTEKFNMPDGDGKPEGPGGPNTGGGESGGTEVK